MLTWLQGKRKAPHNTETRTVTNAFLQSCDILKVAQMAQFLYKIARQRLSQIYKRSRIHQNYLWRASAESYNYFMIVAQGLCSPHSFASTRSLFRAMAQCWSFSQAQKILTQSAQKAVWATHIIKTIEQAQPPKSAAQPSLRERILSLETPSQDYAFDPECKKEVLSLFEGGIVLNPKVFEQDRVRLAQQPKTKEEKIEQREAINKLLASQGKFIFCPNSLVTKHIFEYMETPTPNFFISGGYGISKTVSIILYLHLNNFITKYFCEVSRHKASGTQGQDQQDKVNKAEEMQELQRKRLLRYEVYKYFYWSIDPTQNGQQFIKNLVLQQALQLSQNQRQRLAKQTGQQNFSLLLRSLYPPNVHVRSVVDQINKLASLIRQNNFKQQKINQTVSEAIKQQEIKMNQGKIVQIMRLNRFLRQMVQLGEKFGVNSSATIQRQLLKKNSNEESRLLSLDLQDRQALQYYRVPYENAISFPEGANEFKQLIWFEIARRLSACKINQQQIASIKKRYYEEVAKLPISGFDKFLTVRQLLEKERQLFENLKDNQQEEEFIKQLKLILQQLEGQGMETEKANFKKIFDKSQQKLSLILHNLHFIAEKQMLEGDKRHKLFTFQSKDIQFDEQLKGYNLSKKLQQRYRNTSDFQENLPYQLLEKGMIRLPWTVQQYLIISSEALFPKTAKKYRMILSQNSIKKLREYGGAKGLQFQYQLRECLIKETKAFFVMFTKRSKKRDNFLQQTLEIVQIKHVAKFLHFNKRSAQSFVDHNFKQLLTVCRNNPGQFCVAYPYYIDKDGNLIYSASSKAIDFIICEYDKKTNVFCITTFDATVSIHLSKKSQNFEAFYRDDIFQHMQRNKIDPSQFEFRHVILCPREVAEPMKLIEEKGYYYTLQYADALQQSLISNCKDTQAWGILKEVQRITALQLNYKRSV